MPLDIFVGHKFGMLTVKSFEQRQDKDQKRWYAFCRCDCGKEKWILWCNISKGASTSCGCQKTVKAVAAMREKRASWFATRGEEIAVFYETHPALTLREVGQEFGTSHQYVKQAVSRYFPSDKTLAERNEERKQLVKQMLEERETLLEENERLRAELQAARG